MFRQVDIAAVLRALQSLASRSDDLLVDGDCATAVLVKQRERNLWLRATNTQQLLTFCESKLPIRTQRDDFEGACKDVEHACDDAESTLINTMPSDADDAVLATFAVHLDESLLQLAGPGSPLGAATRMAHVLPLRATDSERIKQLNIRLHDLIHRVADRHRAVDQQLVTLCDSAWKCDKWLELVAEIERELGSPVATSFDLLLKQRATLAVRSLVDFSFVLKNLAAPYFKILQHHKCFAML